jgi:hypothetical protein
MVVQSSTKIFGNATVIAATATVAMLVAEVKFVFLLCAVCLLRSSLSIFSSSHEKNVALVSLRGVLPLYLSGSSCSEIYE